MKRGLTFIFAGSILWLAVTGRAAGVDDAYWAVSPNQRFDIANNLWNPNATGGAQGNTPTSVTLGFNNGGSSACYTTVLAFEGAVTVFSGAGQPCIAPITSMTITPAAGIAGTVYAVPSPTTFVPTVFENQILIGDGVDPIFDTTNGLIKTPGTISVQSNSS